MAPTASETPTFEARSLLKKGSTDPRNLIWVVAGLAIGCILLLIWGAARSCRSICKRLALYKRLMYALKRAPSDSVGLCRRGCMRCEFQMTRWHALQGAARTAGVDADSYAASLASPKPEPQSLESGVSTPTIDLPRLPPQALSPYYV